MGRAADISDRVLAATLALLPERGFAALSLAAVAERAGINRSTMHRRWSSPAALVLEAIAAQIEQTIALPDTGTFREDLAGALLSLAGFLQSPIGRAALTAAIQIQRDEAVLSLLRTLYARRFSAVNVVFERGIARGELPSTFDRHGVFAAAAGSVYFRTIVTGEPIDRDWVARILDVVTPPRPRQRRRSPKALARSDALA